MTKNLCVVLAQLNLTVGDIKGNLEKHIEAALKARDELKADLIVFPELSLIGYPAEDLLLRPNFIQEVTDSLAILKQKVTGIYCLVGHPHSQGGNLFNACSLIYNGETKGLYFKQHLPNYGVFDERRYFTPGETACVVNIKDIPIGLVICEDLWTEGPALQAKVAGAQIILSPNASPFEADKHERRVLALSKQARDHQVAILYTNQVCGQDELVFDGGSMAIDAQGEVCQLAGFFNQTLFPIHISANKDISIEKASIHVPSQLERIYQALVMGVKDYVNKNGFPGVLIGVSGGIDSALTLAIAVDALGKDRVHAVMMPSRYTADISLEDGLALIQNAGVSYETISIEPSYKEFLATLASSFKDKKIDVTEENIQARCRAVILMALSNKFGHLVLTTGNRSELAVGYCTLYGDMAGGYAVLKDIPKTLVYELAQYRNQLNPLIPERTIERPPTAELAPNQKDQDSLPPYPILDKILYAYLNQRSGIEEIIAKGFDKETVVKIVNLIRRNEYKRRQGAIGTHINHTSFGKDWRYPITNGFKG